MKIEPTAKIVSYNNYSERVCASAAKISTTPGNSLELFENSSDSEKNTKLIKKVLASGHASLIEHAVFTIAFANVSAFVEEFFIECRLASFTVKSRRYVDFSHLGYFIPKDLTDSEGEAYTKYMNMLFESYEALLDLNIPKEDARFLLPYSFNSNFYCTINARELAQVINSIEYGHGQNIPELRDLAAQLKEQLLTLLPSMSFKEQTSSLQDIEAIGPYQFNKPIFVDAKTAGDTKLLQAPSKPMELIETAYHIGHPSHPNRGNTDIKTILHSLRPRELEQLTYTYHISDITLSGITHIVRHRMQSIIIPPLQNLSSNRYIVPESVQKDSTALSIYHEAINKAAEMRDSLYKNSPNLANYHYYFILSGTLTDIITTMNARELAHFIRLRSCNRAQWEIRDISIRILKLGRDHFPDLFKLYGPSCYMKGFCPEGRMTCGRENEMKALFKNV